MEPSSETPSIYDDMPELISDEERTRRIEEIKKLAKLQTLILSTAFQSRQISEEELMRELARQIHQLFPEEIEQQRAEFFQEMTATLNKVRAPLEKPDLLAKFLKRWDLTKADLGRPDKCPAFPGTRIYQRAFTLHKPVWPAVRDFVFKIELEFWDPIQEFADLLYPHEALILGANLVEEDEQERVLGQLPFPCCTCGNGCQEKEIPLILSSGWQSKSLATILSQLEETEMRYPLLAIAALSFMLPISIYFELRERLNELNANLAELHILMLARCENFDRYREGTTLSLFERLYHYTGHGGSIGGCWLTNPEEKNPPYFTL